MPSAVPLLRFLSPVESNEKPGADLPASEKRQERRTVMKLKFWKAVGSAVCISMLLSYAVQAEVLKENFLENGGFEQVRMETTPGNGGRADFVRDVPLNWTIFAPTNGDAYEFGDLDPLLGTSKTGQGSDCLYAAVDMPAQTAWYSAGNLKIPVNTWDETSRYALFLDSYTNPGINIWSDEIDVIEGNTYRLSAEFFTGGLFNPGIRFFDENGNVFTSVTPLSYDSSTKEGTSNARMSYVYTEFLNYAGNSDVKNRWTQYQKDYTAPKGAVKARVSFTFKDSGSGFNGKYVVDNVKLQEIAEAKLDIPNASFDDGIKGITAYQAEAEAAVLTDNLPAPENKAPAMRDANVLSVKAAADGGRAETAFLPAYGEGIYRIRFDANYPAGVSFEYAAECFDADYNQLDGTGQVIGEYRADLTLQNPVSMVGLGKLQTNEIQNYETVCSNAFFQAPAGTAYIKLYFIGNAQEAQPLYIDNLECAYRPEAPERRTSGVLFLDADGNRLASMKEAAGKEIRAVYQGANMTETSFSTLNVFALYEKDTNRLAGLKAFRQSVDSYAVYKVDSQTLSVPAENPEHYYVKFMTVSGLEDMIPLTTTEMVLR